MTYHEYSQKRERISVSIAPVEEIEAAIKALDEKYNTSIAIHTARRQFEDSQPDTPKEDN